METVLIAIPKKLIPLIISACHSDGWISEPEFKLIAQQFKVEDLKVVNSYPSVKTGLIGYSISDTDEPKWGYYENYDDAVKAIPHFYEKDPNA